MYASKTSKERTKFPILVCVCKSTGLVSLTLQEGSSPFDLVHNLVRHEATHGKFLSLTCDPGTSFTPLEDPELTRLTETDLAGRQKYLEKHLYDLATLLEPKGTPVFVKTGYPLFANAPTDSKSNGEAERCVAFLKLGLYMHSNYVYNQSTDRFDFFLDFT